MSMVFPVVDLQAVVKQTWEYPVREYSRLVYIIKNRVYSEATEETYASLPLPLMVGDVTPDEVAAFLAGSSLPDAILAGLMTRPLWLALPVSTLKKILVSPQLPADRVQAILYTFIDYGLYDRVLELMTFDAPDASITANTTWTDGVSRYRKITVASGVTITIGAPPGVIIADTIDLLGSIISGWYKGAGGAPGASGAGAGGRGAGGLIILARSLGLGTIRSNGENGGNGSTVAASGAGGAGGAGLFWVIATDVPPLGGAGSAPTASLSQPGRNGGGGGAPINYAGGAGGSSTLVVFATALDLLNEIFKAIVDWWIVNVLGKTPTTTKTIPQLGGAGGGGGGAEDATGACGGGGGGGGQIIIYATYIAAGLTNSVTAKGGNGGAGGAEGSYDRGGGGGGGGIIYIYARTIHGSISSDVSGGAGGSGDTSGSAGGSGIARLLIL